MRWTALCSCWPVCISPCFGRCAESQTSPSLRFLPGNGDIVLALEVVVGILSQAVLWSPSWMPVLVWAQWVRWWRLLLWDPRGPLLSFSSFACWTRALCQGCAHHYEAFPSRLRFWVPHHKPMFLCASRLPPCCCFLIIKMEMTVAPLRAAAVRVKCSGTRQGLGLVPSTHEGWYKSGAVIIRS